MPLHLRIHSLASEKLCNVTRAVFWREQQLHRRYSPRASRAMSLQQKLWNAPETHQWSVLVHVLFLRPKRCAGSVCAFVPLATCMEIAPQRSKLSDSLRGRQCRPVNCSGHEDIGCTKCNNMIQQDCARNSGGLPFGLVFEALSTRLYQRHWASNLDCIVLNKGAYPCGKPHCWLWQS